MSLSNINKATAPAATGGGTIGGTIGGTSYTFTAATGIGNVQLGNITISTDEIRALTGTIADYTSKMYMQVQGGDPVIEFVETMADCSRIKASFEPDQSMTAADLSRVMVLMLTMRESHFNAQCKPITYIKNHNLERHFRFSQA